MSSGRWVEFKSAATSLARSEGAISASLVIAAAAVGALVTQRPMLLFILIGAAVIGRWPTAATIVVLIACQEVRSSEAFGSAASVITLGNGAYFLGVGGLPLVEVLVFTAALCGVIHAKGVPLLKRVLPVVTLGAVVAGTAFFQGAGPLIAISHPARGYLIAAAALILGLTTGRQPGGWRLAGLAGAVALCALALAGSALFLGDGAGSIAEGRITLFYDSALPAFAAAVLLVQALGRSRVPGLSGWTLTVATAAIVVLSGRRGVWLALMVAAAVWLAVRYEGRQVARAVAVVAAAITPVVIFAPSLTGPVSDQFQAAVAALMGEPADSSTTSHVTDLEVGWQYAANAPSLGYGWNQGPLPGLATQSETLYLHNDFLLQWLKYGWPAALGLAALMGLGVALSVRAIRAVDSWQALVPAAFLVLAPVCGLSAAFYTTTLRWPAMLGLAAGMLLAARDDHRSGEFGDRRRIAKAAGRRSPSGKHV